MPTCCCSWEELASQSLPWLPWCQHRSSLLDRNRIAIADYGPIALDISSENFIYSLLNQPPPTLTYHSIFSVSNVFCNVELGSDTWDQVESAVCFFVSQLSCRKMEICIMFVIAATFSALPLSMSHMLWDSFFLTGSSPGRDEWITSALLWGKRLTSDLIPAILKLSQPDVRWDATPHCFHTHLNHFTCVDGIEHH